MFDNGFPNYVPIIYSDVYFFKVFSYILILFLRSFLGPQKHYVINHMLYIKRTGAYEDIYPLETKFILRNIPPKHYRFFIISAFQKRKLTTLKI